MGDLLNPYQRTAVISSVREFEKSLREAIRWLDDASEDCQGVIKALFIKK
jgi:hypothetical protein